MENLYSYFEGTIRKMEIELLDSDFSDEEIAQFLEYERRPYTVRPRPDYFETLDDVEFRMRFRLSKETVLYVLVLIESKIESKTDRNHSISPITKLLLTLRFYALGSMLLTVADFAGVSKSSACHIVRDVSQAIAALGPTYIKMPSGQEEILQAQEAFYRICKMPRVIGAIDCTHVRIQSPGGNQAETFRNRKGHFSLNVQTISSADLRILDIVARWPGSAHDQTIFNKSKIKRRFMAQEFDDALLVGDSGYANTAYMITPFLRTSNRAEELYNESQIRTRNPVERQYGVWKKRFPVLSLGIRLKLPTTMSVILATAVLHNLAVLRDELPPADPEVGIPQDTGIDDFYLPDDDLDDYTTASRDFLVREYFSGMATRGLAFDQQ